MQHVWFGMSASSVSYFNGNIISICEVDFCLYFEAVV